MVKRKKKKGTLAGSDKSPLHQHSCNFDRFMTPEIEHLSALGKKSGPAICKGFFFLVHTDHFVPGFFIGVKSQGVLILICHYPI